MTREEEIKQAVENNLDVSIYTSKDGELLKEAFYIGAKWADEHSKLPWIKVEEDLPCNHEEMVYINSLDQFDQRTSWCIVSDGRFISMDRMYNFTGFTDGWKWGTKLRNVKYWCRFPKLPKE